MPITWICIAGHKGEEFCLWPETSILIGFLSWLAISWMTTDHHYGIHGWKSPFPSILKWLFFGYQNGVMIQTPETGVSASWVLLFRDVGIKPIHPISCLPQKNMVIFFFKRFFGGGWGGWGGWGLVGPITIFFHTNTPQQPLNFWKTSTPWKFDSKSPLKLGHPKGK